MTLRKKCNSQRALKPRVPPIGPAFTVLNMDLKAPPSTLRTRGDGPQSDNVNQCAR